jgi:PBSX family phage terminase large subunit
LQIKTFSAKQIFVLTWWYSYKNDAIICDGAIRSGKTFCLAISFILWAFYEFNFQSFALCGKTIKSLKRNVLAPILPVLTEIGFKYEYKLSENILKIYYGNKTNYFYIFGGKDESSASLIQGMTLSGALFDEVVLMPESFVQQALARCSVAGAKFWFNCNPDNPSHWFYRDWILKKEERNIILVKFYLEDNPSLSRDIILKYHRIYSGSFYERFIQGKWCSCQGLIYPFAQNLFFPREKLFGEEFSDFALSCDYGIINPFSCGLWGKLNKIWYRIDEYYYDSKIEGESRTDEEHFRAIEKLIGNKTISFIAIDPSAAGFITLLRKRNFKVFPAKNNVLEGINNVAQALKLGKIKICNNCKDAMREFSIYKWQNSIRDFPTKENDHAMDDIRYFIMELENNFKENAFFVTAAMR